MSYWEKDFMRAEEWDPDCEEKVFLARFPPWQRARAALLFSFAARGCFSPGEVIAKLKLRMPREWPELAQELDQGGEDLDRFARWALRWAAIPREERQRILRQRGERFWRERHRLRREEEAAWRRENENEGERED
jgi:hypothetical protein